MGFVSAAYAAACCEHVLMIDAGSICRPPNAFRIQTNLVGVFGKGIFRSYEQKVLIGSHIPFKRFSTMLEPGVDYPVVSAMRHLSHELIADFCWVDIGNSQLSSGITIESGDHVRAAIRDARFFNGDDVGSCFGCRPHRRDASHSQADHHNVRFFCLFNLAFVDFMGRLRLFGIGVSFRRLGRGTPRDSRSCNNSACSRQA